MLLIGGGGFGKSRIVNLVLTALFLQFWGPRGCVEAAQSNRASRGILGKRIGIFVFLFSLNGHHVERSINTPQEIKGEGQLPQQ